MFVVERRILGPTPQMKQQLPRTMSDMNRSKLKNMIFPSEFLIEPSAVFIGTPTPFSLIWFF